MTNQNQESSKATKPSQHFELKTKGKLEVSPVLASQINELHSKVGDKEWSGVLVYEVVHGDINDPESFHVIAKGIFPMDVGTGAYTEYEAGAEILDIYDHFPKASPEGSSRNPWRLGQIHTHHNMGAFFSGTDVDELKDNAGKYAYYISLIVDIKGHYKAKVAFVAKRKTTSQTKFSYNTGRRWRHFLEKKKEDVDALVTFDLEVTFQNDQWFKDRVEKLTTYKPVVTSHRSGSYNPIRESQIGFKGGHVETTKDGAAGGDKTQRLGFSELIRNKAVKLLAIEGKPFLKTDNWYLITQSMDDGCIDDTAIREYITQILSKLDSWLSDEFTKELEEGKSEKDILSRLLADIRVYSNRNRTVALLTTHLEGYIVAAYKDNPKDDDDGEVEYYNQIYGTAHKVNSYRRDNN